MGCNLQVILTTPIHIDPLIFHNALTPTFMSSCVEGLGVWRGQSQLLNAQDWCTLIIQARQCILTLYPILWPLSITIPCCNVPCALEGVIYDDSHVDADKIYVLTSIVPLYLDSHISITIFHLHNDSFLWQIHLSVEYSDSETPSLLSLASQPLCVCCASQRKQFCLEQSYGPIAIHKLLLNRNCSTLAWAGQLACEVC